MAAQTHPPLRWVIVSDGSTDRTDEIVDEYRRRCDWIELIRMPEHRDRSFAAKVHCFNAGFDDRQGSAVRRHRQSRRRHLVRAGLLRVPAGEVCGESAAGCRGNALRRGRRALRLPVHEHRARVRRLPAVPTGVLRGDRRIRPHQGRRHRLDRRDDRPDEGLADANVHREDLPVITGRWAPGIRAASSAGSSAMGRRTTTWAAIRCGRCFAACIR